MFGGVGCCLYILIFLCSINRARYSVNGFADSVHSCISAFTTGLSREKVQVEDKVVSEG